MSLGFQRAGFESVWALDNDTAAVETYRANLGDHADCDDIEQWLSKSKPIPKADVVVGGPPCQGFSLLNKQRVGDARRALWQPYLDIVERSEARAFVIENVPGLLIDEEGQQILARAKKMGFSVVSGYVNAADYGVPQTRKRAIILGWRKELAAPLHFPPLPTHAAPGIKSNLPPWITVREAIGDLPPPEGTEIRKVRSKLNLHFGRSPSAISLRRYKKVPEGGNRFDLQRKAPELTPACWVRKKSGGTDLFGRLWWNRPSVTIRTEFFKPEKGRYLHPDQHRPITHREAARLMSFPDSFVFQGSKIEIARQIGNAVPPLLATALGELVMELFTSKRRLERAA